MSLVLKKMSSPPASKKPNPRSYTISRTIALTFLIFLSDLADLDLDLLTDLNERDLRLRSEPDRDLRLRSEPDRDLRLRSDWEADRALRED